MIRAIAAIDDKRGIATAAGIPWSIPTDSRYFRDQTEHSIVLMGKETYQEFALPLPNRRNVVVSRSLADVSPGFELIDDVDAFLSQATEDVWIIGGAGLYASTLNHCDKLYLTHVAGDYNCNRLFPAYEEQFNLVSESASQQENNYKFHFSIYARKNR